LPFKQRGARKKKRNSLSAGRENGVVASEEEKDLGEGKNCEKRGRKAAELNIGARSA